MRVLVVVPAALLSLGTLGSLGALAFGPGSIRVVTDTQALPASVRLLTVDTGDVPLVVRLTTDVDAKEPRVNLRMVTSTDDTQLAVANDDAGSGVTLSDSGSEFLRFNSAGEIKAGRTIQSTGARHIGHMLGPPSGSLISPVTSKPNRR